ncbi:MAG: endopeptidase La [Clostridia bacterium]|nr:endopeptidase La [Clostridia bacterium]
MEENKNDKIISDKPSEEVKAQEKETKVLPVIALRGKVLFPNTFLNFDAGRPISVAAVEAAPTFGNLLFIATQKNAFIDAPTKSDIFTVGVIARIKQVASINGSAVKVAVEALSRAKIVKFVPAKGYFAAEVKEAPYIEGADELLTEAYFRVARDAFSEFVLIDKRIQKDAVATIMSINIPDRFIDSALSIAPIKEEYARNILAEDYTVERLKAFDELMRRETEISKIEKKITSSVRSSIDKSQKEFYLREQMKAIRDELGDGEDDRASLERRIKEANLPQEIADKAMKELGRLDKINPSSPDYSVILNYLDWILDLPFNKSTVDRDDIAEAKKILDTDHFGLSKVKERITEYIAVLHLTKQLKGPILCFVGPPGVGKTSVATSIARALNRKFVRMSLGGVKDEAEIRGHRKTYVGAMPGRIIYGLKTAGVNNPVFLLDEIDKLSSDIHGDPASALLEVLDPEQNATFRDRFLEVPFDLSKVMFITTANTVDTIPYPLLDRMEIIELTGYTQEEKQEIAKQYLIPKQIKNNGLTEKRVEFTDDAVKEIVEGYTMEAGVRNLEREIGSVIRKVAALIAEHPRVRKQVITEDTVKNYLGARKFIKGETLDRNEVGACTGLAWTSVGGVILTIEVSLLSGKGEILLTGKLGDVMKESARAAISYIHANAEKYGIAEEKFTGKDIHIHVPEGATPKDGPSAGITMATAILSAFTEKAVKKEVAMTGEITLRGKVLPIGGLKEKSLAAYRAGIKTVIIPKGNFKDLEDLPKVVKKQIKFITAETIDTVFKNAIDFGGKKGK